MFEIWSGDSRKIVGEIAEYMKSQGLMISKINLKNSSPYAILSGKTSVGYRTKSKWNKTGIVFFCSDVDAKNLSEFLGLSLDDNSTDPARPHAVFVKNSQVADVVRILKKNPLNSINSTESTDKIFPYEFIRILKNKSNVSLVKGKDDDKYYVRKEYLVYNEEVFQKLKNEQISGLPKLVEITKQKNKLYTVEEYIDGQSLYEIIEKRGTLSEDTVKSITVVLCRILKRLHHMNPSMIHRDIKPSNIMIGTDKKVYLIDFNASKEVHENTSEDTVLYGTQYFAAPEQLTGYKASEPTADIFGLGATISYLLTGMYHSQLIAPGRYQKILERCLRLDPKDRYQSIEEFESDFLKA